jgi:hypothetical protein
MILTILYEEFVHDVSSEMTANGLSRYLPGYPLNGVKFALSALEEDQHVAERMEKSASIVAAGAVPRGTGWFAITENGINEVARWKIADFEATLSRIVPTPQLVRARTVLPERVALTDRNIDRIETAEGAPPPEAQREVALDQKSKDFSDAIKSLDAALKEFAADKKGDNRFGDERSKLVSTLIEGRKLLDSSKVRVADVLSKLISPMRSLLSKHQGEMVNATVATLLSTALQAVLKLFGLG